MGDILATTDEPPGVYFLGRVTAIIDDWVTIQFYHANSSDINKARFRLAWSNNDNKLLLEGWTGKPPRGADLRPWEGTYRLDSKNILRTGGVKIQLTDGRRLTAASRRALSQLDLTLGT